MNEPSDPQLAFDDIQRFVSREAFDATKLFVEWYQSQGQPLEIWLGLVAALAIQQTPIDELSYSILKGELEALRSDPPKDGVGLKNAALDLVEKLICAQ